MEQVLGVASLTPLVIYLLAAPLSVQTYPLGERILLGRGLAKQLRTHLRCPIGMGSMFNHSPSRAEILVVSFLLMVLVPSAPGLLLAEPMTVLTGQHDSEGVLTDRIAPPGTPLEQLEITFKLRNGETAQKLLDETNDPNSPSYGEALSHDEVLDQFGPSNSEVQAIVAWLVGDGFQILSSDRDSIKFSGTVGQAETAFGVSILTSEDGHSFGHIDDPQIPARFAEIVGSILGLSNLQGAGPSPPTVPGTRDSGSPQLRPVPRTRLSPGNSRATAPAVVIGNNPLGFGVADFRTFYDENAVIAAGFDGGTINGQGDCVAIPEFADFSPAGVTVNPQNPGVIAFDNAFGLPAAMLTKIFVDTPNVPINSSNIEDMIDIEWAHAVAPGAPIDVYIGDPTLASGQGLFDAVNQAVQSNLCSTISLSIFICGSGANSFYQNTLGPVLARAALQKQAVFALSGDVGAANYVLNSSSACVAGTTLGVLELGTNPNVTAVGGTQFAPIYASNSDVGFASESTWNDSSPGASGGGVSSVFAKPGYQSALPGGSRLVPDVSLGAGPNGGSGGDPGFYIGTDSGTMFCCTGGTSLATAAWAGIYKVTAQRAGARIGSINPMLYSLGGLGFAAGLRNVTSGNNTFNGVPGLSAGAGYDETTGWGSVDIGMFVNTFVANNALITGGTNKSAETYNAVSGTFTSTVGTMTTVRALHTATLLDSGLTLVAGGQTGSSSDATGIAGFGGILEYAVEGMSISTGSAGPDITVAASADLYNPATRKFTATGNMNHERVLHNAVLLNNGQVLIAGGDNATSALSSAELYNPSSGQFTPTGSMSIARSAATATLLSNGKVLVAGGAPSSAVAELYDPIAGTFSNTGSLPSPRSAACAALLPNGNVLIAGGANQGNFLSTAEIYNPTTGGFSQTGSMSVARDEATCTLLPNGQVLVAGGTDCLISCSGGMGPLASAEVYNPATGGFTLTANKMDSPRFLQAAALLNDGQVLISGGGGTGGNNLATADLYNPASNSFSQTGNMNVARSGHTESASQ